MQHTILPMLPNGARSRGPREFHRAHFLARCLCPTAVDNESVTLETSERSASASTGQVPNRLGGALYHECVRASGNVVHGVFAISLSRRLRCWPSSVSASPGRCSQRQPGAGNGGRCGLGQRDRGYVAGKRRPMGPRARRDQSGAQRRRPRGRRPEVCNREFPQTRRPAVRAGAGSHGRKAFRQQGPDDRRRQARA